MRWLGGRAGAWRRGRQAVLGVAGIALFLGGWELGGRTGLVDPVILAPPSRVGPALARQWATGNLHGDVVASAGAFLTALALATLVGVSIGIAMGLSRTMEHALDPYVWYLSAAPLVAFQPLIVVWVGFGFPAVVTLAFVLAVLPIIVTTATAVRTASPVLVRAVRAFGGAHLQVVSKVVLPEALPLVLAGIRLAIGRALVGIVVGEMFSANVGLGYRLTLYGARLRMVDALVPLLLIVALGVVATEALRAVEQRGGRWRST